MLHEDPLAQLRRDLFKLVDYELTDAKTRRDLEQRIKRLTPKEKQK